MAIKHGIKTRKGVRIRGRAPSSRSNTKTFSAKSIPEPVRLHLHTLTETLRDIEGMVIISAGALRDAGDYTGAIVAHILRTQVSNRLSIEIDRITELLGLATEDGDE